MSEPAPATTPVQVAAVLAPKPPNWGQRFIRGLSPVRLAANLRNPILQKEIYVAGRRRSTYVLRCVLLLILLAVVSLSYLPMMIEMGSNATGLRFMQRVQELAPVMTLVIVWFEYVTLLLIGPILVGGSLCDERRSGTLGALMTTPLTAFQIASGKLIASLSQMVILILLALPIILALRIFGGVSVDTVLGMACVIISSAILASTLSMFYSAKAPRGFNAAVSGIFTTAVLHGAVPLLFVWLGFKDPMFRPTAIAIATGTCGPAVLGMSSAELMGESPLASMGYRALEVCLYNSLYSVILSVLAFIAVVFRLRKVMLMDAGSAVTLMTRKQKRKAKAADQRASAAAQSPSLTPDAATPQPAAVSTQDVQLVEQDSREVGDRPVLWRELAQPAFRTRLRFIFTLVVIGGLLLYLNAEMDHESDRRGANYFVNGFGMVLSLIVGLGATAHAFTQERESRTLDVLLTTPLTAREIVWGKFMGALRRQWFLPTVVLVHLLLSGVLAAGVHIVAVFHVGAIFLVTLSFVSAVGVWMSAISKKTTGAGVRTALIAMGFWVLPFLLVLISVAIFEAVGSYISDDTLIGIAAIINPVYLAIVAVGRDSSWNGYSTSYELPRFFGSVGIPGFTLLIALYVAAYGLLAALALYRARVVLGRETNRRA